MDREVRFCSRLSTKSTIRLLQISLSNLTIAIGTYIERSTVYTVQSDLSLVPEGITILSIEEGL